jgi:hypothetical protein
MNLKKGQIWVCKEPQCEAEIEVLRSANSTCHGNFTLRCCCGKDLVPRESMEHASIGPAKQEERTRPRR